MSKLFGWQKDKKHTKEDEDKNKLSPGKHKGKGNKPSKPEIELTRILKDDIGKCLKEYQRRNLCWFHGNINRKYAETKLRQAGNTPGSFLVRESNFDPGDFVLSFVHTASKYGHFSIELKADCSYTLDKEIAIHGLDELIDHYLCSKNHGLPFSIKQGLDGEPPPPHTLKRGYTNVLHKAIKGSNTEVVKQILNHSDCPEVNAKDENGCSALHVAVQQQNEAVVDALLSKGVIVNCVDLDGYTPLHRACQGNLASIADLLLSKGDANPQYRHKSTANVPLHEAAKAGHLECAKVLLKYTYAAWTRNDDKKTPYELAVKFGHQACGQFIENYKPPEAKSSKFDWFHASLDRTGAYQLMETHKFEEGFFLVRKSSRSPGSYVLSLCSGGKIRHYEIQDQHKLAYHIDNGPLLPSLEHLVDYYANYSDGLECQLVMAVTPDKDAKHVFMAENGDETDYANQNIIAGIHENGTTLYMEASKLRRPSLPNCPPPPPPTGPQPLFKGQGKHPVQLKPESINIGFELGQGEYGSVLRGVWTSDEGEKVDVAIKTLNEQYTDTQSAQFLQEAEVMVKLDHPCIVHLVGVSRGPPVMLVQELVSLGALLDFLLDYPEKIDAAKDLTLWAAQVACGMLYLENQRFVHRDLATRNILLASKQQAKVGDFGLSRATQGDSDYYRASKGGRWPVKWYAPESINYGTFSSATDVWSFGVTLWEMYTFGDQPYDEMKGADVIAYIEKGKRLKRPDKCPEDIYKIMLRCWSYKSEDRPKFQLLLDFFNGLCTKMGNIMETSLPISRRGSELSTTC